MVLDRGQEGTADTERLDDCRDVPLRVFPSGCSQRPAELYPVSISGRSPRPGVGMVVLSDDITPSRNQDSFEESRNRGIPPLGTRKPRTESAVGTQKVPFSTEFRAPCSTERRAGVMCVKGPTSSYATVKQSGDGCRSDYTSRPEAWSDPRSSTGWRDPVLGPIETHWPGDGPGTTDWRSGRACTWLRA